MSTVLALIDVFAMCGRVGRAQRVSIRSLGWDGQLTIDGITSIPFNFGVQGIVEVGAAPPSRHMTQHRLGRHQHSTCMSYLVGAPEVLADHPTPTGALPQPPCH
jgi:hypothetical protein